MKIKVGIFFGGPSREREISFAGGRTVFDNLNKSIFEAIPIFIDSHRNFIQLDWQYIYKGTIRDFYPPIDTLPPSPHAFQIYLESLGQLSQDAMDTVIAKVGKKVALEDLGQLINVAFLALHGEYGEDGQLQAELEALNIPYTGSNVRGCKIGMDKALQKELMVEKGFNSPEVLVFTKENWINRDAETLYQNAKEKIGFPMVIRPANQGSSIGVSIIDESKGFKGFEAAINAAFFRTRIKLKEWDRQAEEEKIQFTRKLVDIRDGIGFPLDLTDGEEKRTIYHPEALFSLLNEKAKYTPDSTLLLEAHQSEEKVIVEEFIHGREFSCIVLRTEDNRVVALPPTEIIKGGEVFDYRSKYMPGLSRKNTPINLPVEKINAIRTECENLFSELGFQTYARIDGFIREDDQIFLNDPNTTSGMLPSSFFFHQAAEIGLNPSQFLSYIIRISIQERIADRAEAPAYKALLADLDEKLRDLKKGGQQRETIGIILGGYSFERHISVESGRNIFEKLASSDKYDPIPIFLTGSDKKYELYQLPINLLLKDNADDIRDKILHYEHHPVIDEIKELCSDITDKYASKDVVFAPEKIGMFGLKAMVNGVFIALHGRPGEDGQIQADLEEHGLPYNGSGIVSSKRTINKFDTLQFLKKQGFTVTDQMLARKATYDIDKEEFFERVEARFGYPFIAKPVDDGCSSAVKVLKNRGELVAYSKLMFRAKNVEGVEPRKILKLDRKEEFPRKSEILFEQLIERKGASHFLEITGGLLTHRNPDGTIRYEVFEPSETLASDGILSLEEKFLAGEGQNITPARFSKDSEEYQQIATQVRADLEKAAKALDIQGYARIDAFVRIDENNKAETIIIEVNSLPGMTPATCIFHQAAINDYKPYEFIDKILEFGFDRTLHAAVLGSDLPEEESAEEIAQEEPQSEIPLEEQVEKTETPTPVEVEESQEVPLEEPVEEVAETVMEEIVEEIVEAEEEPLPETPVVETSLPEEKIEAEVPEERPRVSYVDPPAEETKIVPTVQETPTFMDRLKRFAWPYWEFIKSPAFIRNFFGIILFLIGSFVVFRFWLSSYTRHGESRQVHNYIGMKLNDAVRKAKNSSFNVVVADSMFILDREPNVVLEQDPKPLSNVKEQRRIYLTVTKSTPDMVKLPDLRGNEDYDQYTKDLRRIGVRYRIKERVFYSKLEENTILHFFFEGKKITQKELRGGISVPKGTTLEFVVTEQSSNSVPIPDLVCKRFEAATFLISSSNLNLGTVHGVESDNAWVWKQDPEFRSGRKIRMGEQIDLYLTSSRPSGCPNEGDPSDLDEGR